MLHWRSARRRSAAQARIGRQLHCARNAEPREMPFSLGRHLRVSEPAAQPYPLDAIPARPIALVRLRTGWRAGPSPSLRTEMRQAMRSPCSRATSIAVWCSASRSDLSQASNRSVMFVMSPDSMPLPAAVSVMRERIASTLRTSSAVRPSRCFGSASVGPLTRRTRLSDAAGVRLSGSSGTAGVSGWCCRGSAT